MASPRIKNVYQEVALSFSRFLAFSSVVLIAGFSTFLTAIVAGVSVGLAGAVGGSIAGVVGFLMLVFGSLYEVSSFTCSSCGHTDKVLKQIGYYNCFNCDTKYYIYNNDVKQISISS